LPNGTLEGWVGGSCAQDLVLREALRALSEGTPRLLRLSPEGGRDEEGVVSERMTCHSGGTLEIYVEPFLPRPRLVVVGDSPVAKALASLGAPLGFQLSEHLDLGAALDLGDPSDAWVVIASMGDDEQALEDALRSGAPYVALVASRRRAASLREYLHARGLDEAALARLKAPAGLDIGARGGAEVALSILAEIVQRRNAAEKTARHEPDKLATRGDRAGGRVAELAAATPPPVGEGRGERTRILLKESAAPLSAIDPVCGMQVDVATARWTSDHQGRTIVFCASGCKRRFDHEPTAFPRPGPGHPSG
jgi:xanthine dehydrogenase accessory factor